MPPRDPDIFGETSASAKDPEIFSDVKPEEPTKTAAPVQKPARGIPGDFGAQLSAADAFAGMNWLLEKLGYEAGGKVADYSAKVLPAKTAAGLGYATNLTIQALPMLFGGEAAKAASPAFQSMGRGLMQSALKPSYESLRKGKASQAIETMLQEGVPVTEGGLQKLQAQIGKLDEEVTAAIANSTATVNKGDVGLRVKELYDKFKLQVNPQSDLESIRKAWTAFRDHPLLAGKTEIPVQVAQRMKQGTYTQLGSKPYGELQGASVEAQKSLARGLKETISEAVPGVATANAKQAQLLNAAEILQRRVLQDPNKALLGLTPLGVNPLSWILFMADRMPGLKSYAARGLYSGSKQIPANAARIGIGYEMLPPEEYRGALYDVF